MFFNPLKFFWNPLIIYWAIVGLICVGPIFLTFSIIYIIYSNFILRKPSNKLLAIFAIISLVFGCLIFYLYTNQVLKYFFDAVNRAL